MKAANAHPLTVVGPVVPLARLADVLLLIGILLLATALGQAVLAWFGIQAHGMDGAAIACGLGLGSIAYLLLALGVLGLYRPIWILLLLLVLVIALYRRLTMMLDTYIRRLGSVSSILHTIRGQRAAVSLIVLFGGVALLTLFGALTPPHHYDPLTYHLALPQRFLQTGDVARVPDIVGSDLPLTIELLYGIGLAWGSDAFAQLLHFAFAGITAVAIFGATRRWFDRSTGWLAVAIFLGTPLVSVWSRVADNDLATGCYVLLALIAALRAGDVDTAAMSRRWLMVSGILAGLALSTKYQAVPAVVPLGVWVLILPWHAQLPAYRLRSHLWQGLSGAVLFVGFALVVAAPWYLHNIRYLVSLAQLLLRVGTVQPAVGTAQTDLGAYLVQGLNISPRTPLGYALLPIQAFLRGDLEQRFVVPNPLYLTLPALLFLPRWRRDRAIVLALAMAGSFAAIWSFGVQELRYLLAIFPLLAIGTAGVLGSAWDHARLRPLVYSGLIVSACLTLLLTFLHVGADRPLAVTLGLESRDAYLRQSVTVGATYRAMSYIAANMAEDEQAIFVNETQIYYLPAGVRAQTVDARNVIFDFADRYPTPQGAVTAMQEQRTRYLLVNDADLRWWMQADSSGRLLRARTNFNQITDLLEPVYRDGPADRPNITVYRVPDAPGTAASVR